MSVQGIWRTLLMICLVCGVGFGSATQAIADQTDPRLNDLFDRLQDVTLPAEVVSTERQIWTIWLEPTDDGTQQLLKDGMQSMSRGEYQAALKAFDQLVTRAPEFAEGWNKRATLHFLMDNLARSLEDIAATLELEPRHFGALSGRGLVYAKMEDLERALVAFEEALAVHPKMVGPRINADAIRKILKQREI